MPNLTPTHRIVKVPYIHLAANCIILIVPAAHQLQSSRMRNVNTLAAFATAKHFHIHTMLSTAGIGVRTHGP